MKVMIVPTAAIYIRNLNKFRFPSEKLLLIECVKYFFFTPSTCRYDRNSTHFSLKKLFCKHQIQSLVLYTCRCIYTFYTLRPAKGTHCLLIVET